MYRFGKQFILVNYLGKIIGKFPILPIFFREHELPNPRFSLDNIKMVKLVKSFLCHYSFARELYIQCLLFQTGQKTTGWINLKSAENFLSLHIV